MTQNLDYVQRINRVLDHILANLDADLQLDDLARVACFSSFHFHRVFKSLTQETVAQAVKRLRLDRALFRMAHEPSKSLTDIALDCGFASSSDFSRAFKKRFGVPPRAFDIDFFMAERRKEMQSGLPDDQRHRFSRLPKGENPDGFVVELRDLPARSVAYLRVDRPFEPDGNGQGGVAGAAKRLVDWAEARGVADGTWYGYMWEDPDLVELAHCRYDVAVEVDPDFRPEGDVGRFDFPAMRVAELSIRGNIDLEQRALDYLWETWLPDEGGRRGLGPADQPCFEVWHGRPFAHGYEHFELSLHLPIEPLRNGEPAARPGRSASRG